MTLCPVALAVGCRKCPVFAVCPAKGLIGDQAPAASKPTSEADASPRRKRPGRRRRR